MRQCPEVLLASSQPRVIPKHAGIGQTCMSPFQHPKDSSTPHGSSIKQGDPFVTALPERGSGLESGISVRIRHAELVAQGARPLSDQMPPRKPLTSRSPQRVALLRRTSRGRCEALLPRRVSVQHFIQVTKKAKIPPISAETPAAAERGSPLCDGAGGQPSGLGHNSAPVVSRYRRPRAIRPRKARAQ
jgi:hypothetical protein